MKEFEFVKFFAEKLKGDSSLFEQQKKLIESQYKSSESLFRSMFGTGDNFKRNARAFLRKKGIIS